MKQKEKVLFRFSFSTALRFCVFALIIFFTHSIQAQSTDQSFPTAVTTNQISGTIRARDIGDPRLTTYFYVFSGAQGDIFINVVSRNLDGDIDVFTANGLKPLTKIRVYSDSSDNETGRIIYLRQNEKLLLRVEGRSPNDEPATFQIKFAGSFLAEKATTETEKNDAPQVKAENNGEVRVNSVGTIIEIKPKPTPKPVETPVITETAKTVTETIEEKAETVQSTEKNEKAEVTTEKEMLESAVNEEKPAETKQEKPRLEVVITDNLAKPTEEKKAEVTKKEVETTTEKAETEREVNPLENIKLIVIFKNGTKIERPMSEILRVNVVKGILTIIHKDGSEGRYSILDVAEMTIK